MLRILFLISLLYPFQLFADLINYSPPTRGGDSARVDTSSRGVCPAHPNLSTSFKVQLIAPDHVAHTISARPKLYWKASSLINGQFEINITEESDGWNFVEPLIEKTIIKNVSGLQHFSLAQMRVNLERDKVYRWGVSLVCDQTEPALNIGQSALIKYVARDDGGNTAKSLASNGIFYDAFDKASRRQRIKLLEQINLAFY